MENDRTIKMTDISPTLWDITMLYEDIRTEKTNIFSHQNKSQSFFGNSG